jgi:hypothetical protein
MAKIIRSVFVNVTDTDKMGKVSLKSNRQLISRVDLDEYIKDYKYKIMDLPDEKQHNQDASREV